MFGTIINTAGIVAGGIVGGLFGRLLKEQHQKSLTMACGISVLFIGISGGMQGMLRISDGALAADKAMFVSICLALGTLIGEIIDIEALFEKFGEWLKLKTGNKIGTVYLYSFITFLTIS